MYKSTIRPLLFLLEPERAHRLTFNLLKKSNRIPFLRRFLRSKYQYEEEKLICKGIVSKNRIGLSAGMDKGAEVFNELFDFGFGFIEVGTVTPHACAGNPVPRIFRLPRYNSLISRTGFNNPGVEVVKKRLRYRSGKVTIEEALDVMIPVLRALTAVHAEGFIHRDVTPDNIYITKDGNVKLLDFGSARYSIGDKSKSLDVILKVGYAPKEQYIRRGRQGPYTDVYSCAACLYAAITGFLPPESLERLDHDTLIPPSEAGVEIPLYLERAILKGLAVQPEDRFQTAEEFLDAIESQQVVELPGEKTGETATGQTAPQPAAKKKNIVPFAAAGAAAVVLAIGIGYFIGGSGGSTTGAISHNGVDTGASLSVDASAPMVTIGGKEYSAASTDLDFTNGNLTDADLLNLREMTNLKSLRLDGNSMISDLSPLAELTELEELYLPCPSEITDLTPLSGLTKLNRLAITGNSTDTRPVSGIQDFSPLSNLTSLTQLDLVVTNLEDLSFLSGLTNLEGLRLYGSLMCEDLTALKELTNLRLLRMDALGLRSIEGIENMTALERLDISDDSDSLYLDDLSALAGLTKLQYLHIEVQIHLP